MIDQDIIEQLKVHFSNVNHAITFAVNPSTHKSQSELLDMLKSVAACNPHFAVKEMGLPVSAVRFEIWRDEKPTGIIFSGIPGGHEFTSFILAVLHTAGLGRQPDSGVKARVSAINGPIRLRTFISLSCTNCPDVVQAFNLMATIHDDFQHEVVDGAFAETEIERLGIQGVPSVFAGLVTTRNDTTSNDSIANMAGEKLLHVGKSDFSELLEKLEEHYGKKAIDVTANSEIKLFDVLVLGGGPAGASAAIYSARKGLKTAIITQKMGGQVRETKGIENLISVPYIEGMPLTANLEKHVRQYAIDVLEDRKVEVVSFQSQRSPINAGSSTKKRVECVGGEIFEADSLIIATGAKWRELGIPGEKEYLGRGVAFCPHCDGPFYKGRRVAVVGGGNSGVEAAIDLAGIATHVTLLEYADQLKADQVLIDHAKKLSNIGIITSARTTEVVGNGDHVTALRYQDRKSDSILEVHLDGVFVQIGLSPNSAIFKDLLETNRSGEIVIDEKGRTSAEGVYAAGDVTTVPFKQIIIAMGEGAKAALTSFEDRVRRPSA